PAAFQIRGNAAQASAFWPMRSVPTRRQSHFADVAALDRRNHRAIAGRSRNVQPASGPKGHVPAGGEAARRATNSTGRCRTPLPRKCALLEDMDFEVKIQGPLAGNGPSLGAGAEAAHQPQTRLADCRSNI